MPLQNRVDPFGLIHATSERGLFTGNRGIIHDPGTRTLKSRRWTTKAWIICTLEHPRGTRRIPMGRNGRGGGAGWTELFFLDEVTALAAGHRPCFYCRREAALSYQHSLGAKNEPLPSAPAMDVRLHRERLSEKPLIGRAEIAALPAGSMIAVDNRPFAVTNEKALAWSFGGYGKPQDLPESGHLLTPLTTISALRNGYRAVWHPTAG
jgi:hypothetical protein